MRILLNYANGNFEPARRLNSWTGKHIAGFERVVECGPLDIDEDYRTLHQDVFSVERGDGLWLWKPYLLHKLCSQAQEGDIVFYCDSGSFFIRSMEPVFESLRAFPVWVSDLPLIEEQWTHERCFELGDERGQLCELYRKSNQIQGGFVGIRVCKESLSFLVKWLRFCELPGVLAPGNSCNDSPCIAHREDQSAISLVCKKMGIAAHKDPTQFGKLPEKYYATGREFVVPRHEQDAYKPLIILHRSGCMSKSVVIRQLVCTLLPRSLSLRLSGGCPR